MKNLTLVIPAKNEEYSLPEVLKELKNFNLKIIVIIENSDLETFNAIKNFNIEIIYQSGRGYGDAIIEGINNVKTNYLCIFNADGSFDPKYLKQMLDVCDNNLDFVFASRYLIGGGSDDDTFLTKLGNYIFTKIGNIFFLIKITDILYNYLLGKTNSFKKLNLTSKDFCLCVELPIKAKRNNMNFIDIPSCERRRIAGVKKVNEFKDGLKIFFYMIKSFFKII
jgi:glycosyltransferase involved in cell wall biosynthesis